MLRTKFTVTSALIAVFAMTCIAPVGAFADGTQNSKNLWRNLTIGSAIVAGIGLLNHNNTELIAGAAGAAISATQYEQERQTQSQQQNDWQNNSYYDNGNQYYDNGNQNNGQQYYYDNGNRDNGQQSYNDNGNRYNGQQSYDGNRNRNNGGDNDRGRNGNQNWR